MAITKLTERPGIGELFGTGLGSGISKGLQALAEQKINQLQQRKDQSNMLAALLEANVDPRIARSLTFMPGKGLQREYLKSLRILSALGKGPDLFNLRKQALKAEKKPANAQEAFVNKLLNSGLDENQLNVVTGKELSDDVVRYFLTKAGNDPKKAKKLARKFGYEV